MKREELEAIKAIREELREAFDAHAMAYDQARVMNAHRMINRLAEGAKARGRTESNRAQPGGCCEGDSALFTRAERSNRAQPEGETMAADTATRRGFA